MKFKDKLRNFFKGFGSVLDIWPSEEYHEYSFTYKKRTPEQEISEAWQAVWKDMDKVFEDMDKVLKKVEQDLKNKI